MLSWVSLIRGRIDSFAIGRLLGSAQIGLYAIAVDIGFLTSSELVGPVCPALFPGLVLSRRRTELYPGHVGYGIPAKG
jgi:O-antigen/teichoic acid export membrane protein